MIQWLLMMFPTQHTFLAGLCCNFSVLKIKDRLQADCFKPNPSFGKENGEGNVLAEWKLLLFIWPLVTLFLCPQILPTDAKARRLFVTSGGLKKVQEIHAEPGTTLSEYITIINCCFPEEIVRLLSFLSTSDYHTLIQNQGNWIQNTFVFSVIFNSPHI